MSKILTYIGMHFKLSIRPDKNVDKKSRIMTTFMGVLVIFVGLLLCYLIFDVISDQFLAKITPKDFSVALYTILGIVLLVVGISMELKLYLNAKDLKLTARLPLSPISQFVAHLIIVFIYMLIISIVSVMSVMCIYGAKMGLLHSGYLALVFLSSLFAPLVPFGIATLLVVPTMYFIVALQNHNIVKLIIFLVIIAGLFTVYSILLNFLADYYIHQKVDAQSQERLINIILSIGNPWNFFSYLSAIAFGDGLWAGMGIILSASIVFMGAGILIAIPIYDRIRLQTIEGKKKIFSKPTKITNDKPFMAIFKKEIKEIIRTTGYAFFYLGIAIVTPIMVYLTSSLIQKVGKAQMGGNVAFGVSILVVLAFISMINSFAGSSISREGKQFYITKIVPVDFRVQLLAKGFVNFGVSVIAVLISLVILYAMKFVTVVEGLVVLACALLMTMGIIASGFNINVARPNINMSDSEESQSNTLTTMLLGIGITAIQGILGIFLSFFIKEGFTYLIVIGISLIYAVINVLVFVLSVKKKYLKIE